MPPPKIYDFSSEVDPEQYEETAMFDQIGHQLQFIGLQLERIANHLTGVQIIIEPTEKLCERCEVKATFHYTHIRGGEVIHKSLCEECANGIPNE